MGKIALKTALDDATRNGQHALPLWPTPWYWRMLGRGSWRFKLKDGRWYYMSDAEYKQTFARNKGEA